MWLQLLLKAETKYFPMQAVVADSRETADSLMIVETVKHSHTLNLENTKLLHQLKERSIFCETDLCKILCNNV